MASGLSRVTIVAPRSRLDVALPSDVVLADLLPTVLDYAGTDLGDDPTARNGWTLSRLNGAVLDSAHTPAQLDVRDGELLYLRPRGDEIPNLVFDDLVDAVATGTRTRAGRWTPATTRLVGLTIAVVSLVIGAVAVLFAGPPQLPSGLLGMGLAVAMLVVAVVFARVLGDTRSATAFALVSCVYGAVGGLLILAGNRTPGQLTGADVLVAATVALVVTALAAVGVADNQPVFLCIGVCVMAVLITAAVALVFDIGSPAASALTVTVAFAALPALPMLAYRLAGLPIPTVPTEREHLRQDTENVDGATVLDLAQRADAFLAGMLSALAIIGASAAVLISPDGMRGTALCIAVGLLMMARARWFISRAQRVPLLAAGGIALAAGAAVTFVSVDHTLRLAVVFGATLAIAAIAIGFGLTGGRRRASPIWGRTLDGLEVLLILSLVPLAIWVSGLYHWIRAVRG